VCLNSKKFTNTILTIYLIRSQKFTEYVENNQMSRKGKRTTPTPTPSEDDDYEFVLQKASQKKAGIASQTRVEAPTPTSPCDLFGPLPEGPLVTFPTRDFPENVIQEYPGHRSTSAELEEIERLQYLSTIVPDLREGALIHRRVREWAMTNVIKPGVNMFEMCTAIEDAVRRLSGYQPVIRGLAFPCGCSLNNCAAHDSPNHNDGRVLAAADVLKIDIGVNINGHIIDSAFTVCFDDKFTPLLEAAREATRVDVKTAGIDVRLCDIGPAIQKVFDASSFDINGKDYDIKPVANLGGHLLKPCTIHAEKPIPLVRGGSAERMDEGELYACETFGTTGKGRIQSTGAPVSHFMVNPHPPSPRTPQQRRLLKTLQENFSTLAFSLRFLDYIGEKKYQN
jgi:methionyl aminopeptidase